MTIIEISSKSEGEVTFEFRCSRPSCIPGRYIYCLMHKSRQIINSLKEFDSQSPSHSAGSERSMQMAEDNHSGHEGSRSNVEGSWVDQEVFDSYSKLVTIESLVNVHMLLSYPANEGSAVVRPISLDEAVCDPPGTEDYSFYLCVQDNF